METEQTLIKSREQKKSIKKSAYSEEQIDIRLNKAVTNSQTIGIFTPKKKEKVLLENK